MTVFFSFAFGVVSDGCLSLLLPLPFLTVDAAPVPAAALGVPSCFLPPLRGVALSICILKSSSSSSLSDDWGVRSESESSIVNGARWLEAALRGLACALRLGDAPFDVEVLVVVVCERASRFLGVLLLLLMLLEDAFGLLLFGVVDGIGTVDVVGEEDAGVGISTWSDMTFEEGKGGKWGMPVAGETGDSRAHLFSSPLLQSSCWPCMNVQHFLLLLKVMYGGMCVIQPVNGVCSCCFPPCLCYLAVAVAVEPSGGRVKICIGCLRVVWGD